jgi:hypothetical protein
MTRGISDKHWEAILAVLEQVAVADRRGKFLARCVERLVLGHVPRDDREAADSVISELLASRNYADAPYDANEIA